jgi:hypothetical protein
LGTTNANRRLILLICRFKSTGGAVAGEITIFILIAAYAQQTGATACFDAIFGTINAIKTTCPAVNP